ncbi:MAG: beta-phosphoglucomutase [Clostridiales bacterium]|nr:beta-phosphoglucomutase [Clostridiales bacterium]
MAQAKFQAAIFDLDGVLADTARFHYLAWKDLADKLGFAFTPQDGERIKGVARMEALEVVLRTGHMQHRFSAEEKERMAREKNALYVSHITRIDQSALLPGTLTLLPELRRRGVKVALGSASKNARIILEATGILPLFDAIADGTRASKAKPDPEVFLLAASDLMLDPGDCAVFEDAYSGIEAAHNGGMYAVGVGSAKHLPNADMIVKDLSRFHPEDLF